MGIWKRSWQAVLVALGTVTLAGATATMPVPGTLNYVEGQVSLQGENLSPKSVGTKLLETNQVLDTQSGNAEILLTPGVFLRVGANGEIRMLSPKLEDTSVQLVNGSAMLEVAELYKENNLNVVVGGAATTIEKQGLYDFNAAQPFVGVLDGQAVVSEGDQHVTVKKGHQIILSPGAAFKTQKLDKNAVESDPLYRWSELRGEYESEANVDAASTIMVNGGWYGPGWYWDPFWSMYSWVPGGGMWYSPFGWGFYSPGLVWQAPYYYHRYPGVVGTRNAPPRTLRGGNAPAGRSFRPAPAPRMMAPAPRMMGPRMGMGGARGGFGGHGR